VSPKPSLSDKQHALESAFHLFNQLSEELTGSYRQLQMQVLELSKELAAARSERMVQLAEKERLADRLERLLETLPAAVIVLDGDDRIREFNPAAEALLGSLTLGSFWMEILQELALTGGVYGQDLKLKSGRLLTLTSSDLEQAPGRILVMLDVTENRRLQERLNRRERLTAMGEMSAQLAHQMRTPLSTALLYTSHLATDQLDPQKRRQFTAKLRDRLQHMERQIQDILMFARGGEAGESIVQFSDLLREFAAAAEQTLAEGETQLQLHDLSRGEARMVGRGDALQGLFNNLLENAIQHHASLVSLTLRVDEHIEIGFEDNGVGVPEPLRQRVFDPFFTTRTGGTGLGLAVVQNMVLSHGGEIHLEQGEMGGACFHLRFPLAMEATAPTRAQRHSPIPIKQDEQLLRSLS
jgi:two-component system sensor histidine kinase FlrB